MGPIVTHMSIQCGCRHLSSHPWPGAACEAAFNECFIGSIEARTCAKRRPVDGWVLIYHSVQHPGDNFFKRKLI